MTKKESKKEPKKQLKKQKFYRPLVRALVSGLGQVFEEERPSSKVLEGIFKKNTKWGSTDRRLFAKTFYEIVRWRLALSYEVCANTEASAEVLAHYYLQKNDFDVAEPLDLSDLKAGDLKQAPMWVRFSFSKGFHEFCKKEVDDLEAFYKESQKEAPVFIRTNTHKTDVESLQKLLQEEDVETKRLRKAPAALMLKQRQNVFAMPAFKNGFFEVQDGGSQLIAPFLLVEPGQRIIDACAGSGGKSLHLANLLKNSGKIIALDIYDWKLKNLKKRAKRNSLQNIETKLIENQKTTKRLHTSADRVLLDVPCTGSGVFRRNPDSKYRWKAEDVQRILDLQKDLLARYSKMLKPGGKLVYSTCSIFPAENTRQIQSFLNENPNWNLEEEQSIQVGENGFDGFYMARLRRAT